MCACMYMCTYIFDLSNEFVNFIASLREIWTELAYTFEGFLKILNKWMLYFCKEIPFSNLISDFRSCNILYFYK